MVIEELGEPASSRGLGDDCLDEIWGSPNTPSAKVWLEVVALASTEVVRSMTHS